MFKEAEVEKEEDMAEEKSACCALPVKAKKQAEHVQNHVAVNGVYSNYNLTGDRLVHTNSEKEIPSDTFFNTPFGDGPDELPVEKNRYRLIWTPLCPWATRLKITKDLLGIGEDIISTGKVNPVKSEEDGWIFSLDPGEKDPILGIHLLSESYKKASPDGSWNATVPALVDVATGKVVNNDYHTLPNQFETAWKKYHKQGAPDLYPEDLRYQIDALNTVLFNDIGNRVYKVGYAETQADYELNFFAFYHRLDAIEAHLGKNRFLLGNQLTDSDIRLYVALARLDTAYYFAFRLNGRRLRDYDNLWNYAKELYSIPAFHNATDFDAIKRGYYLGAGSENPLGIIPDGPDNSVWDEPNNRAEKFGPLEGFES